jgi:hypothetical protein
VLLKDAAKKVFGGYLNIKLWLADDDHHHHLERSTVGGCV